MAVPAPVPAERYESQHTMTAIVVKDLVKRFGRFTAVDSISFEVAPGQVTALLGPNGAGKTTAIELLEGFTAPTAGIVRVLDTDPRKGGRAWRARIGLVLQSTSLDGQLTVTEALSLFGGLYPAPRPVAEILEVIDLASDARTRIGALSGGQRRRVDLGIAIIGQPELLFLDEPTTGLDPEARRRLWSITHFLQRLRLVLRPAALAHHRDVLLPGAAGGRRGDTSAPALRCDLRSRPARAPCLDGGLPGAFRAVLPLGSDSPGPRGAYSGDAPQSVRRNLGVSHRPAARGQRGEQRGGLGLPNGEFSDSHRQAG